MLLRCAVRRRRCSTGQGVDRVRQPNVSQLAGRLCAARQLSGSGLHPERRVYRATAATARADGRRWSQTSTIHGTIQTPISDTLMGRGTVRPPNLVMVTNVRLEMEPRVEVTSYIVLSSQFYHWLNGSNFAHMLVPSENWPTCSVWVCRGQGVGVGACGYVL